MITLPDVSVDAGLIFCPQTYQVNSMPGPELTPVPNISS